MSLLRTTDMFGNYHWDNPGDDLVQIDEAFTGDGDSEMQLTVHAIVGIYMKCPGSSNIVVVHDSNYESGMVFQ